MKHVRKPMAILLTVILLVQLVSGIIPAMAVSSTAELTDHSFHGEGLWLTEIYPNDAERSKTADTRPTDGCIPVTTFDSASDLMEFIEVISTHDEDFKLNDVYQIYANTNLQYITTMSGSSDITVKKGQPIVIWNERTDVRDNDGITLPTEAQIRKDLRIPDNALLLKASTGKGWDNVSTFTIKVKATGETLCTFTPTANVHVKDGLSCELKMPFWKSETTMEVYQPMNLPSPGYVYHDQVRGYIKSIVPEGYDGKGVFISEIRPNDVNRNSSYGTDSDYMECLEITNTTDAAITLNTQYKLYYSYKESDRKLLPVYQYSSSASNHVGSSSGCTVPAGGTAVIWCFRYAGLAASSTSFPTLTNFRNAYGIASSVPVYIFVNQSSLNDTMRGLELFSVDANGNPDEKVSSYFYHGDTDVINDTSVYYRFDGTGSWYRQTEGGIRVPNMYESVLPANELFDHDYVEFYITSTNPYRTTAKAKAASNGVASALDVDALKMTVDFDTTKQSISENSFSAYLATNEELGTVAVGDGTATLDVTDLTSEEDHYWYADLNNADSGYLRTGVYEFTTTATPNFYLFGYINGADYACEGDAANMGEYMFDANGKLTAIIKQDSYVAVKSRDNANWYMTQSYSEDTSAVFYNTNTGASEKLFVPGNVEITFTLTENADGSLTLSYVKAASVKPTLKLKAPTLEFKDMITVNAFFTAENIQDVVEMGMITYSYKSSVVSVETAEHRIPGAAYIESSGRYLATSQGIHAKYLGDTVYLAVYAELKDGSFVYTILAPYSPVDYATNQIKNSTNMQLKQLCAAMLNYGAEAQLFFGHNTSALANASLTAEQKALPEAYRADMVAAVPAASAAKQDAFANNKGFAKRTPSISFEGAFCINYFFTPNYAPVDGITMYYWNEADYNAVSVLTAENATGSFKMNGSGASQYNGSIEGIAAKALSEAVYVAATYSDGTTTWTSGVLGYSIGSYCSSQASKGAAVSNLAMATAVYGYQAKQYFG